MVDQCMFGYCTEFQQNKTKQRTYDPILSMKSYVLEEQ